MSNSERCVCVPCSHLHVCSFTFSVLFGYYICGLHFVLSSLFLPSLSPSVSVNVNVKVWGANALHISDMTSNIWPVCVFVWRFTVYMRILGISSLASDWLCCVVHCLPVHRCTSTFSFFLFYHHHHSCWPLPTMAIWWWSVNGRQRVEEGRQNWEEGRQAHDAEAE